MKRHADACSCGGLWVGGVCTDCQTICQCDICCNSWDDVCAEMVAAFEKIEEDKSPEPDAIYNRLVKRLKMAGAQYKLARGRLPYPTEEDP